MKLKVKENEKKIQREEREENILFKLKIVNRKRNNVYNY